MKRLSTTLLLLALGALACARSTVNTGPDRHEVTRTVVAFADTNGNGARDLDEAALPDVLVISDSNVHAEFTRLARFTNAGGEAKFELTYTHSFDIKVVSPCGYHPSSATAFDARNTADEIEVGFVADNPQTGTALVRVHVWDDANRNGVQDEGEEPVETLVMPLDIPVVDAVPAALMSNSGGDDLAVIVNDGRGEFNLGNSCGTLRVRLPYYSLWEPVSISPQPVFEVAEGKPVGVLRFEYGIGETDIEIGLDMGIE